MRSSRSQRHRRPAASRPATAPKGLRIVVHVLGWLLTALGAAMLFTALIEAAALASIWRAFFVGGSVTVFVGIAALLASRGGPLQGIGLRGGFLLTVGSWTVVGLFAAIPLMLAPGDHDYTDAVFEAVSGLTTTGSTVFSGLDEQPRGILFWRALLQWLGGIGIIATAIVMFPFLRIGGMQLFRTESSDRSDKVLARAGDTGIAILTVYVALTVLCALLYQIGGMNTFDAICHAMTTLSTGGFANYDASFAHFDSAQLELTATLFMVAGALPFLAYVRTLWAPGAPIWRDAQVQAFLVTILVAGLIGGLLAADAGGAFGREMIRGAFNVVSIITTTGYASGDFQSWGAFAVGFFFLLFFLGGCTGSTTGSVKIFRYQVVWRETVRQLEHLVSPNRIRVSTIEGRPIPADVVPSVLVFLFLFFSSIMVGTLGLAATGLDLLTSLSASVTALTNVGPGLGPIIGPSGSFAPVPDAAKWLLVAGMLLGRLEVFTVFVLLTPGFWRG